ncbi:hypothetical protein GGTG_00868 [Gaeumannomyces tritici R3-111a-1]|uniref:Transcription initiation factor IIE subunit beta n=1 Tax=Gaeumannomyces tritici (strain R3-111a-1) TaxID=644352 RepID=J3NHY2_GAET3|nr:hypothetical protein GGTG_00868 [Gaeumannomyces tritici R3-111a-1]EJT80875.1 hypothetical protein GGTG_00868 [Gaeumannomyces tritici R3-111a-1]
MSYLDRPGKGPRRPPPSPSPSVASTTSAAPGGGGGGGGTATTPTKKQKRDSAAPIFSQPANTGFGTDVGTNIIYIVEYLKKEGGAPRTLDDLLAHVGLTRVDERKMREVRDRLLTHTKVKYNPETEPPAGADPAESWRRGTYEHCPTLPGVKDEHALLAHLRSLRQAQGLAVKDIKDGWADCEKAIDRMEAEHKLLVVRAKKGGLARSVWIDDPALNHDVDDEFKILFHRVEMPAAEDMVRKLTQVGQKPTSEDPRLKIQAVEKKQKKKSARRSGAQRTNTHMAHLLEKFNQK